MGSAQVLGLEIYTTLCIVNSIYALSRAESPAHAKRNINIQH
jgi:hypothetical protein